MPRRRPVRPGCFRQIRWARCPPFHSLQLHRRCQSQSSRAATVTRSVRGVGEGSSRAAACPACPSRSSSCCKSMCEVARTKPFPPASEWVSGTGERTPRRGLPHDSTLDNGRMGSNFFRGTSLDQVRPSEPLLRARMTADRFLSSSSNPHQPRDSCAAHRLACLSVALPVLCCWMCDAAGPAVQGQAVRAAAQDPVPSFVRHQGELA